MWWLYYTIIVCIHHTVHSVSRTYLSTSCTFVPLDNIFDPFNQPLQIPCPLEGHSLVFHRNKSANSHWWGDWDRPVLWGCCLLALIGGGTQSTFPWRIIFPGRESRKGQGCSSSLEIPSPCKKMIWTHVDEDDSEAPVMSLHGGSQLVGKY